jgi:tetratricopeptide (TPR) repeat protein
MHVLLLLGSSSVASGQTATLRGSVVDEQGRPLAGVKVEMEYKGESRQKIVRSVTTDKKGGYVRVGLASGPWTLTFSQEGFHSVRTSTDLSSGGVSELPPVVLRPAAPAVAGPTPAAAAEPAGPRAERAKELSETYHRALEALKADHEIEAEALFREVLAAAPAVAEAHYNLGYLASKRGDGAAAEAEFRKAIELQPKASDSYVALAVLLGQTGRGEEALRLLQDAAGDFAADGRFQFALGAAAFNLGRGAEAEVAFGRAAELDAGNVEVHFFLGSLALGRNDVPAALAHLEKYVVAAPEGSPNMAAAKGLLQALKKRK